MGILSGGVPLLKLLRFFGIAGLSLYFAGGPGLVSCQSDTCPVINLKEWGANPKPNVLSPYYLIQLATHEEFIVQLLLDHFGEIGYDKGLEKAFHPELFDTLRL